MGAGPSTSLASVHVVVVGSNYAGARAAIDLQKEGFRVTTIDPRDKFYHVIGGPRCVVDDGFEESLWVPLDRVLPAASSLVSRLRGRVVGVDTHSKRVTYLPVSEFSSGPATPVTLAYDFLVLATGTAAWHLGQPESDSSVAAMLAEAKLRTAVRAATRVAVIGGGAVGVEVAGEIKTDFPDKSVTLFHSGGALMSSDSSGKLPHAFHSQLLSCLRSRGVTVHLHERVAAPAAAGRTLVRQNVFAGETTLKTASGAVALDVDLVLCMTGSGAPNTGFLRKSQLKSALDARGFVCVEPTWQAVGFPDVFALGDVTTGNGDGKYSHVTHTQASEVAANIAILAREALRRRRLKGVPAAGATSAGEPAAAAAAAAAVSLRRHVPAAPMAFVTVGRKGGAAVFMGMVLGDLPLWGIKARDAFAWKTASELGYGLGEVRALNEEALRAHGAVGDLAAQGFFSRVGRQAQGPAVHTAPTGSRGNGTPQTGRRK